jgi:hypothetical protein
LDGKNKCYNTCNQHKKYIRITKEILCEKGLVEQCYEKHFRYHFLSQVLFHVAFLPCTIKETTVLRPAPTPLMASHRYWPWCSCNTGCIRSVPFGNICTPLPWIDKSWYSLGCLPGPKLPESSMLFDSNNHTI